VKKVYVIGGLLGLWVFAWGAAFFEWSDALVGGVLVAAFFVGLFVVAAKLTESEEPPW